MHIQELTAKSYFLSLRRILKKQESKAKEITTRFGTTKKQKQKQKQKNKKKTNNNNNKRKKEKKRKEKEKKRKEKKRKEKENLWKPLHSMIRFQ